MTWGRNDRLPLLTKLFRSRWLDTGQVLFIIPIAFILTMNEQAWSIYGLYGQPKGERFRAGPTREIPSEQDGPISPARVANQNAEFDSSCPLADSATGS